MPETLLDELADGVVSFDRAVAETRLHTTGAREDTVLRSRGLDLAGVRRLAARHTRICLREGAIVEKALNARAEELGVDMPPGLRMALALTTICQDSLYAEAGTKSSGDPIVTITADANLLLATDGEAGAEITGGPRIGAMALQEMLCVGKAELNLTTDDGILMGIGRTTTSLPPRLRRAIARDGACVIDGCTSRYRLRIHHVIERSNGGTDDPSNLATLCWTVILSPACGGRGPRLRGRGVVSPSKRSDRAPSTPTAHPAEDDSNGPHHQPPEPPTNPSSATPVTIRGIGACQVIA